MLKHIGIIFCVNKGLVMIALWNKCYLMSSHAIENLDLAGFLVFSFSWCFKLF